MMVYTCGIYLYSTKLKKILGCHATHSPWNTWSIPKGLKDEGEHLFEAAVRELNEETGVVLKKLHVLKTYMLHPVKYKKQNKILESFLVITDADLENFPFSCHSFTERSLPEVDRWKWISLGMVKGMFHESQQENLPLIEELIKQTAIPE